MPDDATTFSLSPQVAETAKRLAEAERPPSPEDRELLALTHHLLLSLGGIPVRAKFVFVHAPLLVAIMFGIGAGYVWYVRLMQWVSDAVGGPPVSPLLFTAVSGFLFVILALVWWLADRKHVALIRFGSEMPAEARPVTGFDFPRPRAAEGGAIKALIFFALCFGIQSQWIYLFGGAWTPDLVRDWPDALLLTADNACRGILFDTFEMYDISLTAPVKHTPVTATVFYAFRLQFDATALVLVVAVWRSRAFSPFARYTDSPEGLSPTAESIRTAIRRLCTGTTPRLTAWRKRYPDEAAFLTAVAFHLDGRDRDAELILSVRELDMSDDARRLLVRIAPALVSGPVPQTKARTKRA